MALTPTDSRAAARRAPLWPARYTVIGLCFLAAFICYIDRVNISVAIIPMQERFGWSATEKGLVLSSFFVGYLLFQVPGGWLANRWGGKWVLGIAVAWWSLFTLLTPLASASLPLLVAARVAMGLGEGAMFPGAYGMFGRWAPPAERSRAVALLLSGVPLGTLFALPVTGWLVALYGWPSAFYVFGVVGLLWASVWFLRVYDDPARHPRITPAELELLQAHADTARETPAVPWKKLFASAAVWALIANHFCSNWGLYLLLAWLPSYFRDAQGLSITNAGLFSAAPWLTMFIMINIGAWFADRLIRAGVSTTRVRKLMQCSGLLGSAACLWLARDAATADSALVIMCGVMGFLALTWSGFGPNHLDIAPRYADVLFGITNTAGTIPGIVAVMLTGWLVDASGTYASAFGLAAAIHLAGAALWLVFATGRRVVD